MSDLSTPPVDGQPPVTPPVEAPPVETPPAAVRPEGLPDDLWGDTGFNAERFGQYRAPVADLPANAEGYELPTIDGVEIDQSDPLLGILRTRAIENGMGQAAFSAIITDYAAALKAADDASYDAAMAAIGADATGRIANVSTWLDGKLPKEQAESLKALAADANALLGLERLMNAGASPAPRVDPPPPVARKTHAEIRALMSTPAYSGKAKERSADVIKEVTDWFAEEERLKQVAAKAKAA
jgi:hypothetical protein